MFYLFKNNFKKDFIIIEVEFFGVLKKFSKTSLFFYVSSGITILQLKNILISFFKKNDIFFNVVLLQYSVFSNYSEVLSDDYVLSFSQKLFVLPPAVGG